MQKGMIKMTVLYPNGDGKKFDMDYYLNTHVPLVASLLGTSLKGANIDAGLSGMIPGSQAPYATIGHLYFDSMEELGNSFGPNADKIIGDLPNFTNIEPLVQISEVKV